MPPDPATAESAPTPDAALATTCPASTAVAPRPLAAGQHVTPSDASGSATFPNRNELPAAVPVRPFIPLPETPISQHLTIGRLLHQIQGLDPNLPIRLAINPDFPFTHYVGNEVVVRDGKAYIADDGQEDYLPTAVSDALAWD
ncbi:hypothetical protein [Streptomyces sp. NBC_01220]|uniref:hypothetical protein n=1 Tax=Streptomyces sp. NBC_01220 TaxID=2903781 RepID=UPI00352FD101